MDVTCDNCKAEYDFDDTLLGDKGTTVKCSKCGHVFRVLPPRREPQRSALKVRFRDGHVESIASLRELQQRIQAGTVGVDDELGRDGFNFRRLGDVPELKNFFVRGGPSAPAAAPKSPNAQPGALPYRGEPLPGPSAAQPKRTIMGVGNVEVPPAPRVPNFNQVSAAQALAPTQPAAVHPKNTVQGRAPISSAPTSPGREAETTSKRREPPSQRIPVAGGPASTATAPTLPASPSFNPGAGAFSSQPPTGAFNAPTANAPIPGSPTPRVAAPISNAPTPRPGAPLSGPGVYGNVAAPTPSTTVPASSLMGGGTSSTQPAQPAPAQRPAGPSLRIPESADPRPQAAAPLRPQGLDSIAPGVLKAALNPGSGAPKGPSGAPVRLALDDDEPRRPDGRGRGSSSKLWLVGLGLVALGGGGWVVAGQLKPSTPAVEPAPTAPSAAPAPVEAAPEAAAAAAPSPEPSALAQPEAAAAAPVAPAAEQPAPEPAAPAPSTSAKSEPKAAPSGGGETSAGREPKDYSGWVGRGDKLLKQGDHAGAQQAFEQAVALRGTGSEANSGLGAALLALGQTREAIPYLSRAANNGFAEASVGLGDAYRKLGQKDAAIEAYETYLARLPKGARASYVKLQLEGLGRDPGAGGGSAKPAPSEPSGPASDSYRPAGELTEPAPSAPETAQ